MSRAGLSTCGSRRRPRVIGDSVPFVWNGTRIGGKNRAAANDRDWDRQLLQTLSDSVVWMITHGRNSHGRQPPVLQPAGERRGGALLDSRRCRSKQLSSTRRHLPRKWQQSCLRTRKAAPCMPTSMSMVGRSCSATPYPEHGHPLTQPAAFSIMLRVDDIDAWYKRAVEAGCTPIMPPADMFWGDRYGQLKDPYGVIWALNTPNQTVAADDDSGQRGRCAGAAARPPGEDRANMTKIGHDED